MVMSQTMTMTKRQTGYTSPNTQEDDDDNILGAEDGEGIEDEVTFLVYANL
jgi:hypothetical protein